VRSGSAAHASKETWILGLCGLAGPLALFALLAEKVTDRQRIPLDGTIMRTLSRHVPATPVNGDAVAGASAHALAVLLGSLTLVFVWRGRMRYAVFWLLAVGGTLLFDPVLKELFKRPGVHASSGYSFPSGTAMLTMAAAAGALFLVRRGRAVLALACTLAVVAYGAYIVDVGWHYPSDIFAGWALALAWVTFLWLVLSLVQERRGRRGMD
jgi:undecaprenyl-diphosphatase